MNTNERLVMIDNAFSDFIMKKSSEEKLGKQLGIILNALEIAGMEKKFDVYIVHNTKEPFFGMCVYPNIQSLDAIANDVTFNQVPFKRLSNNWKAITDWVIEIDSQCFNRNAVNFTPKELTALLLHEVAHTVYSDSVIERFYIRYQESYLKMKYEEKMSMKIMHILFDLPLAMICTLRSWKSGRGGINAEFYADKLLGATDYQEHMVNALSKIIKEYGSKNIFDNNEKDDKVDAMIKWANVNTFDLVRRKNKLKDDLAYNTIRTDSNYRKILNIKILKDLGASLREKYTGFTMECSMEIMSDKDFIFEYDVILNPKATIAVEAALENVKSESAMEALFKGKSKIPELPSEYDIDALYIECDRVANHYDRVYVLDLIYNVSNQISEFEEYYGETSIKVKRASPKITAMRKRLNELRTTVLSKRNFDKRYQVFVKVPEGYEG